MRSRISKWGCVRPSVGWSVRPSRSSWNHAKKPFLTKITASTSENASYAVYPALFLFCFVSLVFFLFFWSFFAVGSMSGSNGRWEREQSILRRGSGGSPGIPLEKTLQSDFNVTSYHITVFSYGKSLYNATNFSGLINVFILSAVLFPCIDIDIKYS